MLSRIAALSSRRTMMSTSVFYAVRTAATDSAPATAAACAIKPSAESPSALKIKEDPERDLVNFPRRVRPLYPGAVRMGFIPVEWFDFFYKKTGVTGPYLWLTGLATFLVSKEIYVLEHEFYNGIALIVFVYIIVKVIGPQLTAYVDKGMDKEEETFQKWRDNNINSLKSMISMEEKSQWQCEGQKILFEAKRENVALQLEADYRQRLSKIYSEVKKRLDYQVEIQNAGRRIEQQHMVKWIVDNVIKSITPQQEKDALQQCISNLKALSVKGAH